MSKILTIIFFSIISSVFAQVPEDSNVNATKKDLEEIQEIKKETGTNYRVFTEDGQIHINEICDCYPNSLGLNASQSYKEKRAKIKGIALEGLIITNKNFKSSNINSYNLNINSTRMQKGIENYFKVRKDTKGILVAQLVLTISHNKSYQLTQKDIKNDTKREILQKEINKNNICKDNQCYSYFFNDYSIIKNNILDTNKEELEKIKYSIKETYNPENLEFLDFADSSQDELIKIYHIYQVNEYKTTFNSLEKKEIANKIKIMDN